MMEISENMDLRSGGDRCGQRFPVVNGQVHQEQDPSCDFEKTSKIYALLILEASYTFLEAGTVSFVSYKHPRLMATTEKEGNPI